jgi:hypothetical protein
MDSKERGRLKYILRLGRGMARRNSLRVRLDQSEVPSLSIPQWPRLMGTIDGAQCAGTGLHSRDVLRRGQEGSAGYSGSCGGSVLSSGSSSSNTGNDQISPEEYECRGGESVAMDWDEHESRSVQRSPTAPFCAFPHSNQYKMQCNKSKSMSSIP